MKKRTKVKYIVIIASIGFAGAIAAYTISKVLNFNEERHMMAVFVGTASGSFLTSHALQKMGKI